MRILEKWFFSSEPKVRFWGIGAVVPNKLNRYSLSNIIACNLFMNVFEKERNLDI